MEIKNFVNFSLQRLIPNSILIEDDKLVERAFEDTILDYRYHFPEIEVETVKAEVLRNRILGIFLYRLVRRMYLDGYEDDRKYQIHFLMKALCGCEIYWSSEIGEGFHLDHGVGTVIGANIVIGKGFWIYHGCTVDQNFIDDKGGAPLIGNDVIMYSHSQILGRVKIGDKTIIRANSLVTSDIEGNQIVVGNPAKKIKAL